MPQRERVFLLVAGLLIAAALILRLTYIDRLEPFVDEGANILSSLDEGVRRAFDPLGQGRPLLAWMFRPAEFLPLTTVTAARFLVAVTGAFTVAALGLGLRLYAGRRAAVIGMSLWAFLPLAVFHERLALQDPLIAALLAAAFALLVAAGRVARSLQRMACCVGAGLLLGIAGLVKVSAVLALPWIVLATLAVQNRCRRPLLERHLLMLPLGAMVPWLFLGTDLARLGGRLTSLGSLPALSVQSGVGPRIAIMARDIVEHAPQYLSWAFGYGGLMLALLILAAVVFAQDKATWWLGGGWALTVLGALAVYHLPYSRYLLPDHVSLVIFIAVSLGPVTGLMRIVLTSGTVLGALGMWLARDVQIIRSLATAPIPEDDRVQYVTGYWSGNGVHRLTAFLEAHAAKDGQPVIVFTHAYYRPGCYGLMLAARDNLAFYVLPIAPKRASDLARVESVIRRAKAHFDREPAFFFLIESPPGEEFAVLAAAGVEYIVALDLLRADRVSRFVLLRYRP